MTHQATHCFQGAMRDTSYTPFGLVLPNIFRSLLRKYIKNSNYPNFTLHYLQFEYTHV